MKKNKWEAYITVNGKRIGLGYYDSEEEAGLARNEGTKKYFKEYGKLNNV